MLDSFQIADALLECGFQPLASSSRTKAHGYKHEQLEHPVYVKIGGRPGSSLRAVRKSPLVLHIEDAKKVESIGVPEGVRIEIEPYKSAGLLQFRTSGDIGQGRDLSVVDTSTLKKLLQHLGISDPSESAFAAEPARADTPEARAAAQLVDHDPSCRNESPTVRLALINARLGQGGYRKRMLKLWDGQCAVTGCAEPAVLIASHAKRWTDSSNKERLDEFNGLLLSASLDRLFDQGLISFSDDGQLLRKPSLRDADLMCLGITGLAKLRTVKPRHKPYLAAHRRAFDF